MSTKFMFQLHMTLSVTKIMAKVRYLNGVQSCYTETTALNI